MKKAALCVGINKFLRPGNDLRGCVADANQMAELFESLGCTVVILKDADATKFNVLSHLKVLVEMAKKRELSYIGFSWSGHGTHFTDYDEPDSLGEALVCYDAAVRDGDWDMNTLFPDDELRPLLNQIPLTCLAEVPADTCFSGGLDRLFKPDSQPRYIHNPGNPDGLTRIANTGVGQGLNRNIVLWAACCEGETSADAYIDKGYHGAFSYAFMKTWKANPKASRVEILVKTRTWLKANGFDQTPRLKCWNKPAQSMIGG